AATGYATFAALNGTDPLIPVGGRPPIDARDIIGAAVVGLACGAGARVFAWLLRSAKALSARMAPGPRVVAAGAVLAGLVVASRAAFDGRAFSLGPGYRAVEWALDPHRSLALVALLATIRMVATTTSVAGGDGDGGGYEGMVFLDDVLAVESGQWATTTVADVMRADAPVGRPDWTIGQALAAMVAGGVDHLPVVGDGGVLHGVAGTADIL